MIRAVAPTKECAGQNLTKGSSRHSGPRRGLSTNTPELGDTVSNHTEAKVMPSLSPQIPNSVSDTGIDENFLLTLMIKSMHVYGWSKISHLNKHVKLSRSVLHSLLEDAQQMALVEFLGSIKADATSEMRYVLTSKGHGWAADALNQSQYAGPAPVPLADFSAQVEKQNILNERVNKKRLAKSFSELVLPHDVIDRLGPAVNSGKSILLYGTPGNGKTCIAEALGRSFEQTIYVPHCIEVDGQIVKIFDESVHHEVEPLVASAEADGDSPSPTSKKADPRWIHCRRPVVVTGGELTLGMLDLTFNPYAKFYEAPMQMKATGGVFVIDDFGRQQTNPQDILNRWIIPLERGKDYLTLHTGKKFPVPFNELVVFSTNISPRNLADEGTLRRLYYKIEVPMPQENDYRKIFKNVCDQYNVTLPDDLVPFMFAEFYSKKDVPRAGYHPKYLVDQVVAMCEYKDIPVRLDKELVRVAWQNLYAT